MAYLKWVDVAKGIGILCVVVGHAINQLGPESTTFLLLTIRNLIYSFHMPLFFFLSGFLLHYSTNALEFTRKKITRLIIPYVSSFLIISTVLFFSYILLQKPRSFSGFDYMVGMLYGTLPMFRTETGTDMFSPLWFLPALFCALIIAYCLIRVFDSDPILGSISLTVIICSGYVLGLQEIHLPWGFDIAMVAQFFVIPGYYLRKSGYSEIKNLHWSSMVLLTLGFAVAFYFNGIPCMAVGDYYNLFLFFVAAGCAIIGICALSSSIVSFSPVEQGISFFGKNSMVIFSFHTLANIGILYIALIFPRATELYYSNVVFEIACMLAVSFVFIAIIRNIPVLKRIYYLE